MINRVAFIKKYLVILCTILSFICIGCGQDSRTANNAPHAEKKPIVEEKTEKMQAKESHQAVSTTAPSTISEETVKKYTINRTVKQFDEKYKDEENFTDTFKNKSSSTNKFGKIMVRSVSDDDGILLYEYENSNGQIYLALLVYKQSNTDKWGNVHLRYFTYAVQPSLGPVEIRTMMTRLMAEDTVEKDDIKYHSFNNDKNGDKIFAAANKKLFPQKISSMQELIDNLK